MHRFAYAFALFLPLASTPAFGQDEQPFSSLEERMTGSEFNEAGLHKLSPEELAALNQWIRERSVAEYEPPERATAGDEAADRAGGSIENMPREPIQSRIVGTFGGWSGNTEFVLENGMVWKQDESQRFRIQPVENPMVFIEPGFGGSWRLTVEGHNRSVRVERIR
ncbi:MAG: hypothetical protein ACNS61_11525 [Candidatus Wenzhouxiangella sp. M2_3B_020]